MTTTPLWLTLWSPPPPSPMGGMTPPARVRLQFLQKNITEFFQRTDTINFDEEMERLEKERRLEIQRRKELAWRDRRSETRKQAELKEKRLVKATLGTITARTSALRLREEGEAEALKRPRDDDGEWLRAIHTPPKKQRPLIGERGAKSLVLPSKLTSSGTSATPAAPVASAAPATATLAVPPAAETSRAA